MSLATLIAIAVLVVGVPLNLSVARELWRLSRESPNIGALRERAWLEVIVLVTVVVFGIIFLFNDKVLPIPFLDSERTKLITRAIILALAILPALYWRRLSRRRR